MPNVQNKEETLAFKIALGLICVPGVLLPMQMVPGWAMFDLGWPPWAFYAVMAGCWGTGWALIEWHYRAPAAFGGMVAGAGCLAAITTLLANTTWTHSLFIVVVGAIGAGPGALAFWLLCRVQDLIVPPPSQGPPPPNVPDEGRGNP